MTEEIQGISSLSPLMGFPERQNAPPLMPSVLQPALMKLKKGMPSWHPLYNHISVIQSHQLLALSGLIPSHDWHMAIIAD